MVFAFDTLSFARHLREHGVPQEQAEAHAEAVRTFVMVELVTKQDLSLALEKVEQRFDLTIENLKLALTVRLGLMIAGSMTLLLTILGVILKLT